MFNYVTSLTWTDLEIGVSKPSWMDAPIEALSREPQGGYMGEGLAERRDFLLPMPFVKLSILGGTRILIAPKLLFVDQAVYVIWGSVRGPVRRTNKSEYAFRDVIISNINKP